MGGPGRGAAHYPRRVSRHRFPLLVGGAAVVYLAVMAVVFALLSAQNADFVRTATQTQGTVVALVPRAPVGSTRDARTDARAPSLAPKVTYVVAGRTYTYVAAHGRYRLRLQVGDPVTVLYASGDPSSARLRGEGQDLGPVVSGGFGLAAVLLLLLLLLKVRRNQDGRRTKSGAPRVDAPTAASVAH